MERALARRILLRDYFSLTKPGIIFGNLVTAAGGFALASKPAFNPALCTWTLLGLSLIIASACVCNNCIDRESDQKMDRTKQRLLARGDISVQQALVFASILAFLGTLSLALFSHLLALLSALLGFVVYVALYSIFKHRLSSATLIGSIAGAMPPVVGYSAASGRLDFAAVLLFAMVALWQMPHFFAIAIYRLEEYAAAQIPVLPLKKGILATKVQMLFYIIAFVTSCFLLFVFGYAGAVYLTTSMLLGLTWLLFCLQGFKTGADKPWARKMFLFSLVVVLGLCAALAL